MPKEKQRKTKQTQRPKPTREQSRGPVTGANKRIMAQNRKLLGKHYANKYRIGA
jgi:hypothetical protein